MQSYRPLKPANAAQWEQAEPPRKKRNVALACETCRKRKSKCDGIRPICGACGSRQTTCRYTPTENRQIRHRYEELQQRRMGHEELYRLFQTSDDIDAAEVFRLIRNGMEVGDLVEQIQDGLLDIENVATTQSPGDGRDDTSDRQDSKIDPSLDSRYGSEDIDVLEQHHPSASKQQRDLLTTRAETLRGALIQFRYMPDSTAQSILTEFQSDTDVHSVLRKIEGGDFEIAKSALDAPFSDTSNIHPDLESELMMRYPNVYPVLGSARQMHQPPRQSSRFTKSDDSFATAPDTRYPSSARSRHTECCPRPHISPIPEFSCSSPNTDEIPDPRLRNNDIGFWTKVDVSNDLAAKAISLYLTTDHPLFGFFESDPFISDLVHHGFEHCSAFMVSALLSFACMTYTAKDASTVALSLQFEQEAEMLWHVERRADTLPALAGLIHMYLTAGSRGKGLEAQKYINDVIEMARRMRLFDIANRISASDIQHLPKVQQTSMAQSAWSAYNYLCVQSMYHLVTPIQHPPKLPIPQSRSQNERDTMADTFAAFCNMWVIASDALILYNLVDPQRSVPVAFAHSLYQRLLSSTFSLPTSMARRSQMESHVLFFHMTLHLTILNIFRPFVPSTSEYNLASFSTKPTSPSSIFNASLRQLKALVLVFKYTSPIATLSLFWHGALLNVANAALKDSSDPNWRFYFLSCIDSYQRLCPCYPVLNVVIRGLLTLAVIQGAITGAQAKEIMNAGDDVLPRSDADSYGYGKYGGKEDEGKSRVRGEFIIDLDLAVKDSKGAKVDVIADMFDDLVLFDEFTRDVL